MNNNLQSTIKNIEKNILLSNLCIRLKEPILLLLNNIEFNVLLPEVDEDL